MNRFAVVMLLVILSGGCKEKPSPAEEEGRPKSTIRVCNVHYGSIGDNLELSGTVVYLRRDVVTASIPAFITEVDCYLGKRVAKGDLLYILETKERKALGGDAQLVDSSLRNFGMVYVRAPAAGIVSTFDQQQKGNYVLEGALLCTVAENGSLAIQINVPYDFAAFSPTGKDCSFRLADGSTHNAVITTPLTTVNTAAQTQSILARPTESLFLPENLIVRVLIRKGNTSNKQLLPKSCVQSDEMMKKFWIMKLINDSTAVKEPVTIGNRNDKDIEILTPQLSPSDLIILEGAYGLPDTALVTIAK